MAGAAAFRPQNLVLDRADEERVTAEIEGEEHRNEELRNHNRHFVGITTLHTVLDGSDHIKIVAACEP